jgi:hypothetical protein
MVERFRLVVRRRGIVVAVLVALVATAGCVRNVKVPPLLPVEPVLGVDALVERVNGYDRQRQISAPVTLQFRDRQGAAAGRNKEYPAADGRLVLLRPNNIRLQVKFPVVGTKVADMASDGDKFQVKVFYPENKRKFIEGSNAARYKRVESDTVSDDPALQRAGALANMRPQHLTDAFLIKPVALDGVQTVYFLDEERQVERDMRSGAKKGAEVERRYYVLTMLERVNGGPEAQVTRRFWFDRTVRGTPLARQELYEDGRIATRVLYSDFFTTSAGLSWPERVWIERVDDGYSVEVIFEKSEVEINGEEVPVTAFKLENTEMFEQVDLDRMPAVLEPGRTAGQ